MKGICKLYDIETDLKESHIIPKFVYDYTKETGSGFLRGFANPNRRMQDGIKEYLLSNEAEREFSKRETWFANNIFYPYLKENKKQFEYDDRLLYFATSLLWRVLLTQINHHSIQGEPYLNKLREVAEDWKLYLKGKSKRPRYSKVYIYLTGRILYHDIDSDEVDYYFTRTIDATVVANNPPTFVAVYAKFNRFVFWSPVLGGNATGLNRVKINPMGGHLYVPQSFFDPYMDNFIRNRIRQMKSIPVISEKQKKVIEDHFEKNKEKFLKSDAADSMRNDMLLDNRRLRWRGDEEFES